MESARCLEAEATVLLNWEGAQLVEWDFQHALALAHDAGRAAEPLLHERPPIVVMGRACRQPRDVAFFSDESVGYFYSQRVMQAQPLPPPMKLLLDIVNVTLGASFNGVLVNRYKTGKNSVGAHSDSEFALDTAAGVVALSLGATRIFRLRAKADNSRVGEFDARDGYALQMKGPRFQLILEHEIPVQARVTQARLSLTFRKHLPEHEQDLIVRLRKQGPGPQPSCEAATASHSRSPRRSAVGASSFLSLRLTGRYGLRDSTLIDRCVERVCRCASAAGGDVRVVISWDGDPYRRDNFTTAIPRLRTALPAACFVAFRLAPKSGRAAARPAGFGEFLPRMRAVRYEEEPPLAAGSFIGVSVPPSEAVAFGDLGLAALRWLRARASSGDLLVLRTGAGGRHSSREPGEVAACAALAGAGVSYEDV